MSGKATSAQLQLSTMLAQLELSQYEERLRENGFDDWETVTAIKETDMTELGFQRDDRRKLQHAIKRPWNFDPDSRGRLDQEHEGKQFDSEFTSTSKRGQPTTRDTRLEKAEEADLQKLRSDGKMLSQVLNTTLSHMDNLASTYSRQSRWVDAQELKLHIVDLRDRLSEEQELHK